MYEIWWQCSRCWRKYTNDEMHLLPVCFANPENKKTQQDYGLVSVCLCGAIFHKDRWQLASVIDEKYWISTVHLNMAHLPTIGNQDWLTGLHSDYWFETMIRNCKDGSFLSFQMRYKTMDEAIIGHWHTVDMLPRILQNPGSYPESIIDVFCNSMRAAQDQKKTIHPDVKERLK